MRTLAASLSCIYLDLHDIAEITSAISEAQEGRFDWLAGSLLVYLLQTLAVLGDGGQARAWADALQGCSSVVEHAARRVDARLAQAALRIRSTADVPLDDIDEQAIATFKNPALWRTRILAVHRSLICGDRLGATTALEQTRCIRPVMHAVYQNGSESYSQAVRTVFEPGTIVDIAPPQLVTALSVGAALAGAEATAIAGPLTRAADWLSFMEKSLPAPVVTSPEWSVCRKRVEGLLLLRTDDQR